MISLHQCFSETNSTTCLKGGGSSCGISVATITNTSNIGDSTICISESGKKDKWFKNLYQWPKIIKDDKNPGLMKHIKDWHSFYLWHTLPYIQSDIQNTYTVCVYIQSQ